MLFKTGIYCVRGVVYMNDKTENVLKQVEEKMGIKLSDEAKEKLFNKETLGKIMKTLSPSDLSAVAGALSGKDGINALAQNKELLSRIKNVLEE